MRYRTLGRTGLKVSELSMGGMAATGKYGAIASDGSAKYPNDKPARLYHDIPFYDVATEGFSRVMARCKDLGINFLDTAPSYVDSEIVLGNYLKRDRNCQNWIVCTKVGVCGSWGSGKTMSKQQVFDQYADSLERLQVDKIDLLLIHSIDQYGRGKEAVERVMQPGGIVEALQELKAAGKIRFFGVSGQLDELIPAARIGIFDVILTYNTYNLLLTDAADQLFPLAREKNFGVILGGVYYQGLLAGWTDYLVRNKQFFFEKEDPAYKKLGRLTRRLEELMKFVDGDAGALRKLALRFALSETTVSTLVVGMKSIEEVEENVEACNQGPLSSEERQELTKILQATPYLSWKDS